MPAFEIDADRDGCYFVTVKTMQTLVRPGDVHADLGVMALLTGGMATCGRPGEVSRVTSYVTTCSKIGRNWEVDSRCGGKFHKFAVEGENSREQTQ